MRVPGDALPGLDEAVGCCQDPLCADEGASAGMTRARLPGVLDADDPGPGPCLGICATHNARHAIRKSRGPEPRRSLCKEKLLSVLLDGWRPYGSRSAVFPPHKALPGQQGWGSLWGTRVSTPCLFLL